jgi:serine/threonine-protein kinase RsbW
MYTYDTTNDPQAAFIDLGLEENTRRVQISTLAEVYPLFAMLESWMSALDYPAKDIFAVRLSLHEAVTNALQHGNENDPTKIVRIRYLVKPKAVVVEVRDQGRGFKPAEVPDPRLDENVGKLSGRGVFLIRVYSSWVSHNPQGNQVTFCRNRSDT